MSTEDADELAESLKAELTRGKQRFLECTDRFLCQEETEISMDASNIKAQAQILISARLDSDPWWLRSFSCHCDSYLHTREIQRLMQTGEPLLLGPSGEPI
jgi:hypothetical protein